MRVLGVFLIVCSFIGRWIGKLGVKMRVKREFIIFFLVRKCVGEKWVVEVVRWVSF